MDTLSSSSLPSLSGSQTELFLFGTVIAQLVWFKNRIILVWYSHCPACLVHKQNYSCLVQSLPSLSGSKTELFWFGTVIAQLVWFTNRIILVWYSHCPACLVHKQNYSCLVQSLPSLSGSQTELFLFGTVIAQPVWFTNRIILVWYSHCPACLVHKQNYSCLVQSLPSLSGSQTELFLFGTVIAQLVWFTNRIILVWYSHCPACLVHKQNYSCLVQSLPSLSGSQTELFLFGTVTAQLVWFTNRIILVWYSHCPACLVHKQNYSCLVQSLPSLSGSQTELFLFGTVIAQLVWFTNRIILVWYSHCPACLVQKYKRYGSVYANNYAV